jgi:hypothetical protein
VHGLVTSECVSLVYLQETKLDVITDHDVMEMLDQGFGFVYLPAVHTHGGILVAWHLSYWSVSSMSLHSYSISTRLSQVGLS